MKLVSLVEIETRISKRYALGAATWCGADSVVWLLPESYPLNRSWPRQVLKITRLPLRGVADHREMVRLGSQMQHIATVRDVRTLCFAENSMPRDPWFFCMVFQDFTTGRSGRRGMMPPSEWSVNGVKWLQRDNGWWNCRSGIWIDVARLHRDQKQLRFPDRVAGRPIATRSI